MNTFIFYIIASISVVGVARCAQCSIANNNFRLDCFPQFGANENDCRSRGCCWSIPNKSNEKLQNDALVDVPYCYFPLDYPTYQIADVKQTIRGQQVILKKVIRNFLPKEILILLLEVIYETNSRVRVKISDPTKKRFEVPITLNNADSLMPRNPEYQVIIPNNGSFSLEIKRKSDNISIFKTFGPLLYSDQFIQISSLMPTNQVYGIGEQNRPFLHNLTNGWSRLGLWARDNAIETNINLYGTHPFYMGMPANGKAFGTFYFNSNAQEFDLQPAPIITYRTIGGILDMFFFTGGTPEVTVVQYLDLIGKPMLPPFWSLGFHLCRYGFKNLTEMSTVYERNIKAKIPLGIQWVDIDYMDKRRDFTVDAKNFNGFDKFVKSIRKRDGVRFVAIVDPAISNKDPKNYLPYVEGLEMNVFVLDAGTKKPLQGDVWPGASVFPDFTHPNSTYYWTKQIQRFCSTVLVDGLWIDMNEPSNFVDGSWNACSNTSSYDKPFFTPLIRDNYINKKTICASSLHYKNIPHYNLHNIYGYTEAVSTYNALSLIKPNERPFILSRSTFSGSGKYTFHWTGDNLSSWDQLAHSIRQILNFNMFGIPMTGADICGFNGNSNEELCIRWMQLGAFYPFMRNHNSINSFDQDPASWSPYGQEIMRNSIKIRHAIVPYIYTLLIKAHLNGTTVFKPLSFEFFNDKLTHSIDLQFMLGSALLITPVVNEGDTMVKGYFPEGIWYDFIHTNIVKSGNTGKFMTLDAPLTKINIAVRGGYIIPLLEPLMNIENERNGNFSLYCAMSLNSTAIGDLYWDDGISVDSYVGNNFSYVTFTADMNGLHVIVQKRNYESLPPLSKVIIVGLKKSSIKKVIVNGTSVNFTFKSDSGLLLVDNLQESMKENIIIQWIE